MKKIIIMLICLLLCIGLGSFFVIRKMNSMDVENTALEPTQYEEISEFSSVDIDLTTMDLCIKKADENAISYRLYDEKKQNLTYSVENGILSIKESVKSKNLNFSNVKENQNQVILYTNLDHLILNGKFVSGDVDIRNLTLTDSKLTNVSGDYVLKNVNLSSSFFESVSGDFDMEDKTKVQGDVRVKTTSGDVTFDEVQNVDLLASTTSGDIEIDDKDYVGTASMTIGTNEASLKVSTTSGDISIN